jgi:anhydro-N-acetylmuramic acid kinase
LKPEDIVATVTAFTAASIADAYRRFVFPKLASDNLHKLQIILGGGGAKNPELRRMLKNRIDQPCSFLTHDDFGIDNAAKEPLAFAILAHETLLGRPSNVPSATGASRPVILGKIVPGCAAFHSS